MVFCSHNVLEDHEARDVSMTLDTQNALGYNWVYDTMEGDWDVRKTEY